MDIYEPHRDAVFSQRGAVHGVRSGIVSISSLNGEAAYAVWQEKSFSWLERRERSAPRNRDYIVFSILRVVLDEDSTGGNVLASAPE